MKPRACLLLVLALPVTSFAGGVLKVTGTGFPAAAPGTPITWQGGNLLYFTDQGDLSPALPNAQADAFVADAFSRWTSVPTAALAATRGGALAEDVNGTIVLASSLPADIQSTATDKPIAIVYDADGAVTDTFLGIGSKSNCLNNSVFGGPDAYTQDGHFAHALIVLNGSCVQTSTDVPEFRYHFLRIIGKVLGLGWSQLNDNARTQSPVATFPQLNGYPLMHAVEWSCLGGIAACIPNPETLRTDDVAAISRVYPVTLANVGNYSGKTVLASASIQIHGRVLFPMRNGRPPFGMQGVNVIARYVDSNGAVSAQYAATSVSGFLFRGNAGSAATGFTAPTGERFDSYGTGDPALSGVFDISGFQFPPGVSAGTIELAVEAVNSQFVGGQSVGPYNITVAPSGNALPIRIANVSAGSTVTQDVVMAGAPMPTLDPYEPNSGPSAQPIPSGGRWSANFFGYGDTDFFRFRAAANHSVALAVTALDENGTPSIAKARAVTGLWQLSADGTSAPLASSGLANGAATTLLGFTIPSDGDYKIGIMDQRGDGRPDFLYRARLLYAHSASPTRIPAQATVPVLLRGFGFAADSLVTIGGATAPMLSASSTELLVSTPQLAGGPQTVVITDPATNLQSTFQAAVQFGAVGGDHLVVGSAAFSATSAGSQADHEFLVRALDAANKPLAGVAVQFSLTPTSGALTGCNSTQCTVLTDELGRASTGILLSAAGLYTLSAVSDAGAASVQLSAVSETSRVVGYPAQTEVLATSTALVPVRFRVLSNGTPQANVSVSITSNSGSRLTAVMTTTSGDATASIPVSATSPSPVITGCRTGTNSCASISVLAVSSSSVVLQKSAGDAQLLPQSMPVQPLVVRITDAAGTPIFAAPVTFTSSVYPRTPATACASEFCDHGMLKPISTSRSTTSSDLQGLASFTPQLPAVKAPVFLVVTATVAGVSTTFRVDVLP